MLNQAIPVLPFTDGEASLAFYLDGLGFQLDWRWRMEDDARFMQISRDGVRLYLKEVPALPSPGWAYLYVDDVDRFYNGLLKRSVPVDTLPSNRPWRNREMVLSDPDGNRIHICTPLRRR